MGFLFDKENILDYLQPKPAQVVTIYHIIDGSVHGMVVAQTDCVLSVDVIQGILTGVLGDSVRLEVTERKL